MDIGINGRTDLDESEIRNGWNAYCRPGELYEVRILNGTKPTRPRPATWYSYFRDVERLISQLRAFDSWSGVYFTLNPCLPDCEARSSHEFDYASRGSATKDSEIVCRLWLPVDFDPVRITGVSSTEEELGHAFARFEAVRDILAGRGWGLGTQVMSGNGYHLCYPIDLPTQSTLIKDVLKLLSTQHSDLLVSIDEKNFNPSRIWKLPGTISRKGVEIESERGSRRYRISRLVRDASQQGDQIVTEQQLQELLASAQGFQAASVSVVSAVHPSPHEAPRTLEEWIERCNWECGEIAPWDDGRSARFLHAIVCDHDDGAWVGQHASGAMAAGCHHNSCSWGWDDLRATTEFPRQEAPELLPNINEICERLNLPDPNAALPANFFSIDREPDDLISSTEEFPIPSEAMLGPGLIRDITLYNLATAYIPQPELAFGGAISVLAVIISRAVTDCLGTTPNLYTLGLAQTCSGKEHARKVANKLLMLSGETAMKLIGNAQFGSNSGIVTSLLHRDFRGLFCVDEISRLVKMTANPNSNLYRVATFLLEVFTKANDIYVSDALADRKKQHVLYQPHLTLYGTATPGDMWNSLNAESLSGGLIGRFLLLPGRNDMPYTSPASIAPPQHLLDAIKMWAEWVPPQSGNLADVTMRELFVVPHTPEALARFTQYAGAIRERMRTEPEARRALWGRAAEKAAKLALLFACSRALHPTFARIELEDVERAIAIVNWSTRYACAQVAKNMHESPHEKMVKQVFGLIAEADPGLTLTQIARKTRFMKPRERLEVLSTLEISGAISSAIFPTGGRAMTYYFLPSRVHGLPHLTQPSAN